MKSILKMTQFDWSVQKSRFIGFLTPVANLSDVDQFLENCRLSHPQATHVCYACILSSEVLAQRASDDGEPQKTAGIPMLEVLKKNDLTDVLAVVVRYFGGIKLGAGGLIRAYAKTVKSCVQDAVMTTPVSYDVCQLVAEYAQSGSIGTYLRTVASLTSETYGEQAIYTFESPTSSTARITEEIKKRTGSDLQVEIVRCIIRYQEELK
jgi:uncharacterized YigZ family protein